MANIVLDRALERVAEAAYQADIYESLEQARKLLVNGSPNQMDNSVRPAIIAAIAIKGLDPSQNTESHFYDALKHLFSKNPDEHDRALPKLLDKIVSDTVQAMTEERLLGKKTSLESGISVRSR